MSSKINEQHAKDALLRTGTLFAPGTHLTTISQGQYGIVFEADNFNGSPGKVAVKVMEKRSIFASAPQFKHFLQELRTHIRVSGHRNIVYLTSVFDTHRNTQGPNEEYIGIIIEHCGGGTLHNLMDVSHDVSLHRYTLSNPYVSGREVVVQFYFKQLIQAVAYCHSRHVIHRDLKLENVLLQSQFAPEEGLFPGLKLCDFGFSKAVDHSYAATVDPMGTYAYLAPEVLASGPFKRLLDEKLQRRWQELGGIYTATEQAVVEFAVERERYCGKKADIWSCGVMLYYMLFRRFPFAFNWNQLEVADLAGGIYNMLEKVLVFEWEGSPRITQGARDLLMKMLEPFPEERITMAQIQEHPWLEPCPEVPPDPLPDQEAAILNFVGDMLEERRWVWREYGDCKLYLNQQLERLQG